MDDCALAARLEDDDSTPTMAAFPDGSESTFSGVVVGGESVATRSAFADDIITRESIAGT